MRSLLIEVKNGTNMIHIGNSNKTWISLHIQTVKKFNKYQLGQTTDDKLERIK